jgi:hypothetical protein
MCIRYRSVKMEEGEAEVDNLAAQETRLNLVDRKIMADALILCVIVPKVHGRHSRHKCPVFRH